MNKIQTNELNKETENWLKEQFGLSDEDTEPYPRLRTKTPSSTRTRTVELLSPCLESNSNEGKKKASWSTSPWNPTTGSCNGRDYNKCRNNNNCKHN